MRFIAACRSRYGSFTTEKRTSGSVMLNAFYGEGATQFLPRAVNLNASASEQEPCEKGTLVKSVASHRGMKNLEAWILRLRLQLGFGQS